MKEGTYFLSKKTIFYNNHNDKVEVEKGIPFFIVLDTKKKMYTISNPTFLILKDLTFEEVFEMFVTKETFESLSSKDYFIMFHKTKYRTFVSYGTDFDKMAKSILRKINTFISPNKKVTFKDLANDKFEFGFYVYKIKENSCFDTEHLKFNEKDYVGDYLNKYRKTPEKKWSQNRQKYEKWC